ncbi:hypothetical protein ACQ9PO_004420, partial [Cronobacter sakazakii]
FFQLQSLLFPLGNYLPIFSFGKANSKQKENAPEFAKEMHSGAFFGYWVWMVLCSVLNAQTL